MFNLIRSHVSFQLHRTFAADILAWRNSCTASVSSSFHQKCFERKAHSFLPGISDAQGYTSPVCSIPLRNFSGSRNSLTTAGQSLDIEKQLKEEKFDKLQIKLYQYPTCPFCCKARSFLKLHGIPFEMIEVHPLFKSEIQFSSYKMLPIVTVVDENGDTLQINDSSVIISALSSFIVNEASSLSEILEHYPTVVETDDKGKKTKTIVNRHNIRHDITTLSDDSKSKLAEETKWREWVDNYFVHLISPNLYRTIPEAYKAFNYHVSLGKFHKTWEGVAAKYGGAVAMYGIGKLIKKKYNVSEDARLDLYKACNDWIEAVSSKGKFIGGEKPNLADVSMYGVLLVMENLPVWEDVINNSNISDWFYATKTHVESSDGLSLFIHNEAPSDTAR